MEERQLVDLSDSLLHKSDAAHFSTSPSSPSDHYSSCGESEFERYCSANSVIMGTPSMCSSIGTFNDCLDSEFASFKSLGLLVDNNNNSSSSSSSSSSLDSFSLGGNRRLLSSSNNDCVAEPRVSLGPSTKMIANTRNGLGTYIVKGEDDEGGLEHSEGEDSMYGCGTDDEPQDNVYFKTDVQEVKRRDENPFSINTSVAFGSNDWDDFELETEGGNLASLNWVNIQEQKDSLQPETRMDNLNDQLDVSQAPKQVLQTGKSADDSTAGGKSSFSDSDESTTHVKEEPVIALDSYQVQGTDEFLETTRISSEHAISSPEVAGEQVRHAEGITTKCLYDDSADGVFEMGQDPQMEDPFQLDVKIEDCGMEKKHQTVDNVKFTSCNGAQVSEKQEPRNSRVELDPLSDITMNNLSSCPIGPLQNSYGDVLKVDLPNSFPSIFETDMQDINPASADPNQDNLPLLKAQNLDLNDYYNEVVLEMEEILLDSSETPGSRFPQGNRVFQSQISLPNRDVGPTTSTSGIEERYPIVSHPLQIDGVEVIGAKQKKGDVSLSERLVGVKEYTVYKIRVYSGNDHWEVERRYRDFYTLYRRLKSLYADHGWILPSPWLSVEKESRKIFGNVSPDVVSERSALIQECLCSFLQSSPPSALFWFLSNQDSSPSSPLSNGPNSASTYFANGQEENISTLGKTISLIVEIHPYKSTKQMLEAQHYTCAGCHKHFDDGMTKMQDFLQTLGWGKPRLCEYTGQLFCYSCHTNETAVLPARVLHHWDFTQYPVSQLAKSYLDSIHDQPMLCVSAVNPFLFSKVPALQHITSIRKKLGTMLPYVRCPFRRSINKGLGPRKYLLESNDFFALRDLIDLSRGPFAALPTMVETVSKKILEHITDQCLVCCDVGVACGARQACNDPSSLIFPFQEEEVEKCRSCASLFHKRCFLKITSCPCGTCLRAENNVNSSGEASGSLSLLVGRPGSGFGVGILSGLFSRAKAENTKERKDNGNVILMGSLPGSSL
ncbi:hypothetical protein ACFE04_016364 [Oxalis oulophora]